MSINIQNGTEADAASVELSSCIYHSLIGHIGEFDRGIKRARFAVLRLTKIPAVLVESGFLTERGESRLIAKPEWRKRLADAICTGIDNFRTLAENKKRPLIVPITAGKNLASLTGERIGGESGSCANFVARHVVFRGAAGRFRSDPNTDTIPDRHRSGRAVIFTRRHNCSRGRRPRPTSTSFPGTFVLSSCF
jgi:hypothetical protein